jgi:hypothetical protein
MSATGIAPQRRRCPRCGGPVLDDGESEFEFEPAGTCVHCGYRFSSRPSEAANRRVEVRLPTWFVVFIGFLAVGLVAGIIVAALSSVSLVGGWLLVALGVGLVVAMGAVEAGYLDGPKRRMIRLLR